MKTLLYYFNGITYILLNSSLLLVRSVVSGYLSSCNQKQNDIGANGVEI